mgnify:CR=1 FL=1
MAKLTAWLVTIIGILLILPLIGVAQLEAYNDWLIAVGVLIIGVGKLIRNYSKRRK